MKIKWIKIIHRSGSGLLNDLTKDKLTDTSTMKMPGLRGALLCVLWSAPPCLGVPLQLPFRQAAPASLWACLPLAGRPSVLAWPLQSRAGESEDLGPLLQSFLGSLIPLWLWPDPWSPWLPRCNSDNGNSGPFLFLSVFESKDSSFKCKLPPLDLIGFPTDFFVLYRAVGVTALNIFSMCKQIWRKNLDPRLVEVPRKPQRVGS